MAQTRRKRRRKHRGTQGGRIDRRPARGRPRSRGEAQARARSRNKKTGPRTPGPPSWSSAGKKGGIAAILFIALLTLFGQNPAASVAVGAAMVAFYVPMAYMMDRFIYQRHLRKEEKKRAERESERTGARQAGG
jgi:hypothetical protein